jgi:hypothetical protein
VNPKGTIVLTRHLALILAKVAPLLGVFVFVSSVEATTAQTSAWTDMWRIGMSVALGVFVTLVGAIYQNLNRRLEAVETVARQDLVTRREYDGRHSDLVHQLDRIEAAVLKGK